MSGAGATTTITSWAPSIRTTTTTPRPSSPATAPWAMST